MHGDFFDATGLFRSVMVELAQRLRQHCDANTVDHMVYNCVAMDTKRAALHYLYVDDLHL